MKKRETTFLDILLIVSVIVLVVLAAYGGYRIYDSHRTPESKSYEYQTDQMPAGGPSLPQPIGGGI